MKLKAEIVRCKYCGKLSILIDGYGQCRSGCSGHFDVIVSEHIIEIEK